MADDAALQDKEKRWLLALARHTLEHLEPAGSEKPPETMLAADPIPDAVQANAGVFVTLRNQSELRGCIGYVAPLMPLYRAVIENTVNAARKDPRFPPVKKRELPDLDIEISVMSPPREIHSVDEIEIGRHGLIVGNEWSHGLLLPQVAQEYGWNSETFLSQTCRKAGLPANAWREGDLTIEVFSAQVFSESEMQKTESEG